MQQPSLGSSAWFVPLPEDLKSQRFKSTLWLPPSWACFPPQIPLNNSKQKLILMVETVTNISGPGAEAFFAKMVITPMDTLIRGVAKFMDDPTLTGQVAEIHGDNVTIRPHHEFVDEDSKNNIDMFWKVTSEA